VGDHESEGSRRQTFEPTNRNYIRCDDEGDVAKETKAQYCVRKDETPTYKAL